MTQLVAVPLEAEAESSWSPRTVPARLRGGRGGDAVTEGTRTLEDALGSIAAAASIIERLRDTAAPDTISLEFGLTVNASSGMVIKQTSVNANIKVSWPGLQNSPQVSTWRWLSRLRRAEGRHRSSDGYRVLASSGEGEPGSRFEPPPRSRSRTSCCG